MPSDIGIDLGTTKIAIYDNSRGIVLKEPSLAAVDKDNGSIFAIGEEALQMMGRTPQNIEVIRPINGGVISDYKVANAIIRRALKKACGDAFLKPRVAMCIPSLITDVESNAIVSSAVAGGARRVFLIEQPIAAAIGAGIDLSKPSGQMVIDIGGGVTDVAVISMNGIVCKNSVKIAGMSFDEELTNFVRTKYGLIIGERMAEEAKMAIGTCWQFDDERSFEVKGRKAISGLPGKVTLSWQEVSEPFYNVAGRIAQSAQAVFERTPPELAGDIKANGITLTGAGALLSGLDKYLSKRLGVSCHLSQDAANAVAVGTGCSFKYYGILRDGVIVPTSHTHG